MTTIKDIAQMAGVSTATVSRIINGKGEASPETIRKVQKIVDELNYRPSSVAKSLSKRTSNLIALLIPNLNNPFFSELVKAIEFAANNHGYQIFLCNSEDNREKVEYYLETMVDNYVAGAIINSLFVSEEDLKKLEGHGITTITIDRAQFSHGFSALAINHQKGGYEATKHLIESCDESLNLMFVSGPKTEKSSLDRLSGYLDAIAESDANHKGIVYGDFTVESGYQASFKFLSMNKAINGIFCSNDAMALGVLRACQDLKIKVPQQLKIIGYDNIAFGNYSYPRLSTINQITNQIAEQIVEELLAVSTKKRMPKKIEIDPTLVVRESTKETK